MWARNIVALLLFCYARPSTGNGRVYFRSKNFYNVLHWDPVEPDFPGQNILYSVQYWSDYWGDNQKYLIKEECQNITSLSCDLTAETPSMYAVNYKAKVMVNGSCHGITNSFYPLRNTVFGPPLLSIRTTASSLHVNITLPKGPNGKSIPNIINSTKNAELKYTLKITHPQWAAQVVQSKNNYFDINLKYNKSIYCGYVVYKTIEEWGHRESENASFCETLPDDPGVPFQWPLLGAAVLASIVIISAVCLCNYVKGGDSVMIKTPVISPNESKVMGNPDKNLRLSEVFMKDTNQIVHNKDNTSLNSAENSPYSPQNPVTSAQSSGSYAAVGVQPQDSLLSVKAESREEEPQMEVEIVQPLPSYAAPQLPNFKPSWSDPEQEPLVLQTVRGIDGQLQLAFQLGNTDRKLLLSDVTCQDGPFNFFERVDSLDGRDSGCFDSMVNTPTSLYCNTSYSSETTVPDFQQECQTTFPSDAICQSGYKQNWMPERPHEPINIHRHLNLH